LNQSEPIDPFCYGQVSMVSRQSFKVDSQAAIFLRKTGIAYWSRLVSEVRLSGEHC
jgi:hypothetical protein